MRTIKFRVWDKQYNLFLPEDVYAIMNRTEHNSFGFMLMDWKDYKEGEFFYDNAQILEQFTGMLDKNGVEIYEGDVIFFHSDEENYIGIVCELDPLDGYSVKLQYHCTDFCGQPMTDFEYRKLSIGSKRKIDKDIWIKSFHSYHDEKYGTEVIGNIHTQQP